MLDLRDCELGEEVLGRVEEVEGLAERVFGLGGAEKECFRDGRGGICGLVADADSVLINAICRRISNIEITDGNIDTKLKATPSSTTTTPRTSTNSTPSPETISSPSPIPSPSQLQPHTQTQ